MSDQRSPVKKVVNLITAVLRVIPSITKRGFSMKTACGPSSSIVGKFDGKFVYGSGGERIYWIDDADVFSFTRTDTESSLSRPMSVKIGSFENGTAIDEDGEVMLVLKEVA